MALNFKRYDLVLLPDDSEGRILEVLNTGSIQVCKVKRGDHVDYFDVGKLRLKRRYFFRFLSAFLKYWA
ncbi:MAG TPA: hypothetical protein VFW11_03285 [Cyclobacteriaceae bacterium]|nr:hypothetical protein [Cyclobacteriaceae bacterium]